MNTAEVPPRPGPVWQLHPVAGPFAPFWPPALCPEPAAPPMLPPIPPDPPNAPPAPDVPPDAPPALPASPRASDGPSLFEPPSLSTIAPGPANRHQLKLKRFLLPDPGNFRNRSWTPVVLLTEQVFVTQVCAPPVPETAQVPIAVPVRLSRCSSMLPPLASEATRASKEVAP